MLFLDYLALGHWHKRFLHCSTDGFERTVYCGTHEAMRFPGSAANSSTGWSSYSTDGNAERFDDDGHGTAFLVTIDGPGAPPHIEPIEIGWLRWAAEHRDVTAQSFGKLIGEFTDRDNPAQTILRLTLTGVVDPRSHARIDELREIVQNRYHAGSNLDDDAVLVEPSGEQLAEVVGVGVLKRVLERLRADAQSADTGIKRVADHALKLLYRIAWEEQPK